MPLDEEYPKRHRNQTARIREMLATAGGLSPREREVLALAINSMADKASDLNEIFERLTTEEHTPTELGELLIAFELTTEQIRGASDLIDGKLYEIGDRLKEVKVAKT